MNVKVEGRTQKQYREDNKQAISRYNNEYYQTNREHIVAKSQRWRDNNKEKHRQREHQRYHNNKEKILAKRKQKVMCECGRSLTFNNMSEHQKSIAHKQYMLNPFAHM